MTLISNPPAGAVAGCERKIVRTVGIVIIKRMSAGPSVQTISRPRSDDAVVAGAASPTRVENTNTARKNATTTIVSTTASHSVTSMKRFWIQFARSDFGASVVIG